MSSYFGSVYMYITSRVKCPLCYFSVCKILQSPVSIVCFVVSEVLWCKVYELSRIRNYIKDKNGTTINE